MEFLAVPTVIGWIGLALVCSTITFSDSSILMKPYPSSLVAIPRTTFAKFPKSTWKLTYPADASTDSTRLEGMRSMRLTRFSATSTGLDLRTLASWKQRGEESSPMLGLGGSESLRSGRSTPG